VALARPTGLAEHDLCAVAAVGLDVDDGVELGLEGAADVAAFVLVVDVADRDGASGGVADAVEELHVGDRFGGGAASLEAEPADGPGEEDVDLVRGELGGEPVDRGVVAEVDAAPGGFVDQ
jgi:hypothetical protein